MFRTPVASARHAGGKWHATSVNTNKGMLMLRQSAKTIARQVPAIGRLIKQRYELLIEVERLRHQLAKDQLAKEEDAGLSSGCPTVDFGPSPRTLCSFRRSASCEWHHHHGHQRRQGHGVAARDRSASRRLAVRASLCTNVGGGAASRVRTRARRGKFVCAGRNKI
jgi:hypothetical protein